MLNIAATMRELIEELNGKFRNRLVPLSQNAKKIGGIDYAICEGYYVEAEIGDDKEFSEFNEDKFRTVFERFVIDYFKDDLKVVINFRRTSQEIEVYRLP